ncbi:MAG: hypothetical protein ACPL2F_04180 [Dissulfurimicrobium hydrothermale]|uniref:hypothetical protein n=1 Tax=Dissulfurimicrobium hydrothermale TaxID=1750598 RepID=UPI003C75F138
MKKFLTLAVALSVMGLSFAALAEDMQTQDQQPAAQEQVEKAPAKKEVVKKARKVKRAKKAKKAKAKAAKKAKATEESPAAQPETQPETK